ncbi:MAG: dTDP-4-dehydrorhamnose reductase [Gemmatimonadota bacterium]
MNGGRQLPEIWGGVECTVNRVGNRWLDQLHRNGHDQRLSDLDLFAGLGIRALRYPVLWERVAPNGLATASFALTDQRLARLRSLGLHPIVGLLHHGSGPRETSLVDPCFPERFALYARAAAGRYPWVRDWTPVNEPLTTARFSCLYGHWYPHQTGDQPFLRAVVNQCRAIVLAMREIRRVNPLARLIHTDDGGTIFSTAPLQHQAAFENARRDFALDLICGRVGRHHPLRGFAVKHGIDGGELDWFSDNPCPPDIIGINYYVTSDRMLDHRLALYPPAAHGGNGRHLYADVAAVHAADPVTPDFAAALTRYFRTYALPVALTEVHIGCTREEQLRWMREAWHGAMVARNNGADVRAVTFWSLLGSHDWNRLVTSEGGSYESGAFDIRSPLPRPTAVAQAIHQLATAGAFGHPVASGAGWWRRETPGSVNGGADYLTGARHRRILVLGASGTLGSAVVRACHKRGLEVLALTRQQVDVTQSSDVKRAIAACQPWAVVNAAGYVNVDAAEDEQEVCHRTNAAGPISVAEACVRVKAHLVTMSSDLVFDGDRRSPYLENDDVCPVNAYGRSKVAAERGVLSTMDRALIVRTSAFFDPRDQRNFVARVIEAAQHGETVRTSADVVSPTYVPDLADAILDLLIDGEYGIWHLANSGEVSWTEFARRVVAAAGYDPSLVAECDDTTLGRRARRPRYSVLGSRRGVVMPSLEAAVSAWIGERSLKLTAGSL